MFSIIWLFNHYSWHYKQVNYNTLDSIMQVIAKAWFRKKKDDKRQNGESAKPGWFPDNLRLEVLTELLWQLKVKNIYQRELQVVGPQRRGR